MAMYTTLQLKAITMYFNKRFWSLSRKNDNETKKMDTWWLGGILHDALFH